MTHKPHYFAAMRCSRVPGNKIIGAFPAVNSFHFGTNPAVPVIPARGGGPGSGKTHGQSIKIVDPVIQPYYRFDEQQSIPRSR
jgi:hypothetical protein